MNHFRHVNGNEISKTRVAQGQPFKNIGFTANSTVKDYQKRHLYLEVVVKPELDDHQEYSLMSEEVDHIKKQVIITYEAVDFTDEKLVASKKSKARKDQSKNIDEGCTYKKVKYQCGIMDILQLIIAERNMLKQGRKTVKVRAMDDTFHTLKIAEFTELIDAAIKSNSVSQTQYWKDIGD